MVLGPEKAEDAIYPTPLEPSKKAQMHAKLRAADKVGVALPEQRQVLRRPNQEFSEGPCASM